jgi:hypothetical protein
MRAWSVFTLLLAGCSSDDATLKERHDYQDDSGRSCQATLEKTSSGSPAINQSVSCDGEPKACSGESSACFVLSVDGDSEAIRNCPACCKGNSSSFVGAECAIVVCQTALDCVYAEAECQDGSCRCPGGDCE